MNETMTLLPDHPAHDDTVVSRALAAQRGYLIQCAAWLLGTRQAAHAAVEKTLAAAAGAARVPADPATARPWLFGLLKRVVLDTLLTQPLAAPLRDDSHEDGGDGSPAFKPDGHWCDEPKAWGDPTHTLAQPGLPAMIERCIERLPKDTARVYTMREILGLEPREICALVNISQETCAAMLCRARLAMHQRLARDWFAAR